MRSRPLIAVLIAVGPLLVCEWEMRGDAMRILLVTLGVLLAVSSGIGRAAVPEKYRLRVEYGPVKQQPKLEQLASTLKQGRVMEAIADALNVMIDWPVPVLLGVAQCGQSNAFYSKEHKSIVICYELIQQIVERVPTDRNLNGLTEDQKSKAAIGALLTIILHESGHALVDLYEIPVLGKEEDVADQISTYMLLGLPDSQMTVLGGVIYFSFGKPMFDIIGSTLVNNRNLADEHALNRQRAVNISCWAWGRDPKRYGYLAKVSGLTRERAGRCAGEYSQLANAVNQLLGSHIHFQ